jgi:hypothetical protein
MFHPDRSSRNRWSRNPRKHTVADSPVFEREQRRHAAPEPFRAGEACAVVYGLR